MGGSICNHDEDGSFLKGFVLGLPLGLFGLFGLLLTCCIEFKGKTRTGFIAGVITTVAIIIIVGISLYVAFREPYENQSTFVV